MADYNKKVNLPSGGLPRWAWWTLIGLCLLICAPVAPVAIGARAYLRRRKFGPKPNPKLGFMSRTGRFVFLLTAFLGGEAVAVDMFAANFNAVDEHVAPIVGDMVIGALVLIVVADLALRTATLIVRRVAKRLTV